MSSNASSGQSSSNNPSSGGLYSNSGLGGSGSNSFATTTLFELASTLAHSDNQVTAGIGECLHAFAVASASASASSSQNGIGGGGGSMQGFNAANTPLIVEFGKRTIALGRTQLGGMSGRNAFLYIKSKFGLLNASTPLHLQAKFFPLSTGSSSTTTSARDEYVEIDIEAWEELVPFVQKLRVMT
ncbi:hypothetical protein K435DRAFT_416274 [Dendrothele bispora CBS 962.96]|uniref:Uncharacterized protein n=1 Tax=Dendrothele bispora (strain CBS 962.96) TaxID=1314807 RepID=A0A4S8MUJ7_DENBC|nr:hypothetical protein K435DRAFT_416274 [Dendrothele bispora CBS 962.96]